MDAAAAAASALGVGYSQPSLKGARVPAGHLQVNTKLQGSTLLKGIRSSGVEVVLDSGLGLVDFYISGSCGVVYLREEELVQGNDITLQRIQKFCHAKGTFHGVVMAEVTNTSKQYYKELQFKTLTNTKVSVVPVSGEADAVKMLQQLVYCSAHANPLLEATPDVPMEEAMLAAVQSFPGVGKKKARDLLLTFKSMENIHKASVEEIGAIIGKKAACSLKSFLDGE